MCWINSAPCTRCQVWFWSGGGSLTHWLKWCSPCRERRNTTLHWAWTEYIPSLRHTQPQVKHTQIHTLNVTCCLVDTPLCLLQIPAIVHYNFILSWYKACSDPASSVVRQSELHWAQHTERPQRLWDSDAHGGGWESTFTGQPDDCQTGVGQ